MYTKLLSMTYKQCREEFPDFVSISNAKKVIALKNNSKIDSYANDSDIIVYYDMVSDSRPLLLVERLDSNKYSIDEVKAHLESDMNNSGYSVSVSISDDGEFIDIVLTMSSIHGELV